MFSLKALNGFLTLTSKKSIVDRSSVFINKSTRCPGPKLNLSFMNGSTHTPSIDMIFIPSKLDPNESILALDALINLNLVYPSLIEYSGNFFPLIVNQFQILPACDQSRTDSKDFSSIL